VDLNFEVMGRFPRRYHRDDLHRLAGGKHSVHARCADSDSLLAAAHSQPVELRAVEKLPENQRDLLSDDSGTVVLDPDLETIRPRCLDVNPDFRNDTGLLTSIERIVDGLLHGREQRFARIIESEQMPVLGEKFAYGNVALFRRHRFGRQPAPRFGWVGTFWHI